MPIGAKMYEQAKPEEDPSTSSGQAGNSEQEAEGKEGKKSDKDEPVEGEVVDEKEAK